MYPNITLKIENHIPQIIYYPQEGMSREMTTEKENISDLIKSIALKLDLLNQVEENENILENLTNLASEGDETVTGEFPTLSANTKEFQLEENIEEYLNQTLNSKDKFNNYGELSEEVLKELNNNQNLDFLASLIDFTYHILISKTLLLANQLGVSKIRLEDKTHNIRLQSKMNNELIKAEIDFIIADL